jgi:Fic family protein
MDKKFIEKFICESNAIESEPYKADKSSIAAAMYLFEIKRIKSNHLLMAHGKLMEHKSYAMPGSYRDCDVYVGGGKGANTISVPYLLEGLCEDIRSCRKKDRSWEKAIEFHVRYEKIHPHIDGNGRTGRLLMLWMINQWELEHRYVSVDNKYEYYKIFNNPIEDTNKWLLKFN